MLNILLMPILAFGHLAFQIIDGTVLFLRHLARMAELTARTVVRIPLVFKNVNLTVQQAFTIGVESLPLVVVTSIFVGGEGVLQANFQFNGLVPLKYLGFAVSKSLVAELCPVLVSFVVASRVSTAIAAEIASMKNSEQLDAMRCLDLDAIRYLIMPRFIASVVMLPILVIFSELIAYMSSVLVAILATKVTLSLYITGLKLFFEPRDMLIGILKTSVFGAVISITGSYFGFEAQKGASGVGESTTRAVMISCVLILVFDFLIAFLVN